VIFCSLASASPIRQQGDKIRSWNIFRHLAQHHRMHLGCFIDDPRLGACPENKENLRLIAHPTAQSTRARLRSAVGLSPEKR